MDSEESVEEKAIITNLMGVNYVRQPNLDFNKIKETNKYIEYEIKTNNLLKDREGDNHLTNYFNSFIYCNELFRIKVPKEKYMIKKGKKRFAYAVGMFPNPKNKKPTYLDGVFSWFRFKRREQMRMLFVL